MPNEARHLLFFPLKCKVRVRVRSEQETPQAKRCPWDNRRENGPQGDNKFGRSYLKNRIKK
jgi:hypothetical protein